MLENLWNDVRLIYETFSFNKSTWSKLVDDLMIMSQYNCYLLYYKKNEVSVQIRIEKDYIYAEVGETKNRQIYTDFSDMIDLTYQIITPFLREIKINNLID